MSLGSRVHVVSHDCSSCNLIFSQFVMCNVMLFSMFHLLLVVPFPIINHIIPNNYKVPLFRELVDLRCNVEFYLNIQQSRSMITCLVCGRMCYYQGGISDIFLFSVLYNAMCEVVYCVHM